MLPPLGGWHSGGHAANAAGDRLIVVVVKAIIKTALNRRLLTILELLNRLSITFLHTRVSTLK